MGYTWQENVNAMKEAVREAAIRARQREKSRGSGRLGVITPVGDDEFDEYLAAFDQFTDKPYGFYATAMAAEMESARGAIATGDNQPNGTISDLGDVAVEVEDWEGDAADSFFDNFMNPFNSGHIVENHIGLMNELRAGAAAQGSLLDAAYDDVMNVGNKTIDAVEAAGEGSGLTALDISLNLVGAAAAVITAIPTGGATLALALIAGGAAITGSIEKSQQLSGGSVVGVMESMRTLLNKIDGDIDEQQTKIAEKLNESLEEVRDIIGSDSASTLSQLVPNEVDSDGADVLDGADVAIPAFTPPS